MSRPINIRYDNTLPDIEVVQPLYPTSAEADGIDTEAADTRVNGVICPVVKFNNKTLIWKSIVSLSIASVGPLPTLSLVFYDDDNASTLLDTPGPDNTVVVVVTPPFEGIYKKIKLRFYIKDIHTDIYTKKVSCEGVYYCDGLNDCSLMAYGKESTSTFLESECKKLKLGYCTNIDDTEDERYIYSDNRPWVDLVSRTVKEGGKSDRVLSWWIDMWNNVNLVDIYDRYLGQKDDNLTVFNTLNHFTTDASIEDKPVEIPAVITNNMYSKTSPLYCSKFDLINSNSKNRKKGTDRVITTYDAERDLSTDILLQDGSGVKENIFKTYSYNGEYIGEDTGSWLEAPEYQSLIEQKMCNFAIKVQLPKPCFGLMRGGRVNVEWYDESNTTSVIYDANRGMETNIPLSDDGVTDNTDMSEPGTQRLNMKISGQYYIVSSEITYHSRDHQSALNQTLVLSRPVQTYNYSDGMYPEADA